MNDVRFCLKVCCLELCNICPLMPVYLSCNLHCYLGQIAFYGGCFTAYCQKSNSEEYWGSWFKVHIRKYIDRSYVWGIHSSPTGTIVKFINWVRKPFSRRFVAAHRQTCSTGVMSSNNFILLLNFLSLRLYNKKRGKKNLQPLIACTYIHLCQGETTGERNELAPVLRNVSD